MKNDEIEMVEYLSQELMAKYSYRLINEPSALTKPGSYKVFEIEIMESINKWKTELQSMSSDKNFYLRWKKKYLLRKIKIQQTLHC